MPALLSRTRLGDDAFEFEVDNPSQAQALAESLRSKGLAEDVIAGLDRVTIQFDPSNLARIHEWLERIEVPSATPVSDTECVEIEIQYGGAAGPDFGAVCKILGLSAKALIDAHASSLHRVDMIGFTPGFAYISGAPKDWLIPRLNNPRSRVPAGSIGLTSAYTGIYSLAGPGGWPLIGRTDADLFKADRENPFLLKPGQTLKFRAV